MASTSNAHTTCRSVSGYQQVFFLSSLPFLSPVWEAGGTGWLTRYRLCSRPRSLQLISRIWCISGDVPETALLTCQTSDRVCSVGSAKHRPSVDANWRRGCQRGRKTSWLDIIQALSAAPRSHASERGQGHGHTTGTHANPMPQEGFSLTSKSPCRSSEMQDLEDQLSRCRPGFRPASLCPFVLLVFALSPSRQPSTQIRTLLQRMVQVDLTDGFRRYAIHVT
ncbi:hypothetical protein GGS23DRAFT_448246 [Durotheca rogersii]|uniref:uncharacterized protein n=1 Tax=Durotheca rogersii TaxID=419775 RepID=UPI002221281A|nr:uncharacterized protein GGS23DRAFT_448246 [Durotheca rogersii]KAI5864470.1 hypothetical protein GGS23DRAFT_448246 [Durotheca rogersii]